MQNIKTLLSCIFICIFIISSLYSNSSNNIILEDIKKINEYQNIKERAKTQKKFRDYIDKQKLFSTEKKLRANLSFIKNDGQFVTNSYTYNNDNSDSISVMLNGLNSLIVTPDSNITITVAFSNGIDYADIEFWIDMNGDGILEKNIDNHIDEEAIKDNDEDDENSEDGIWESVWSKDDGPQNFVDIGVFILVEDSLSSDIAYLKVEPRISEYSISGQILDGNEDPVEIPNIIIQAISVSEYDNYDMGMSFGIAVTKLDGSYKIYLPSSGEYFLMAFDGWNVSNLFLTNSFYDESVKVEGVETGYDFMMQEANACIEGYVKGDDGNPIFDANVTAWSRDDDFGYSDYDVVSSTDSAGYYNLKVLDGTWDVGTYNNHLIPDYMDTPTKIDQITLAENDTVSSNFMIYKTDATITGNIYLDGLPYTDFARVSGYNGYWTWADTLDVFTGTGYTYVETSDGSYMLSVASAGDNIGQWRYIWDKINNYDSTFVTGYDVSMDFWEFPDNVIPSFDSLHHHEGVQSGSTEINFYLSTISGGIKGNITNNSGDVLRDAWIYAEGLIEGSSGDSIWYGNSTYSDNEGNYKLYLPPSAYNIQAEYWDYDDYEKNYCSQFFSKSVQNSMIEENIVFKEIEISGTVSGIITDEDGNLVSDYYISVSGDVGCGDSDWWEYGMTDENGYYEIDLPSGNYTISAGNSCSDDGLFNEDFEINNNVVEINIELCGFNNEDYCGCWYDNDIGGCQEGDAECIREGEELCENNGFDEYECLNAQICMWEGECNEFDDGLPNCLKDCDGVDILDDDAMSTCEFFDMIWGVEGSCADDCEHDMEVNMIAYMCEGCFDIDDLSDTTCNDWFNVFDGSSPCGECHDDCEQDHYQCNEECDEDGCHQECDDVLGDCHSDCEEYECGCDDGDDCCLCHHECLGDDQCHQDCDDSNYCMGEDGPPECLMSCEGIENSGPDGSPTDFCIWLTETNMSDCSTTCDNELLIELDLMDHMCTGCLELEATGDNDVCAYWTNSKGDDPCYECHEQCGDDNNCHTDCDQNVCNNDDGGPLECIATCGQGVENMLGDEDISTFCSWLDSADTTQCDCSEEEFVELNCFSYICGGLEYIDQEVEIDVPPTCMTACVTTDCGFDPDFDGDICEMLGCLDESGCLSSCTEADLEPFSGISYWCDAPEGCEEFIDTDDDLNINFAKYTPLNFAIHSVYPNPFNPSTDISFNIELSGLVSLIIYDVNGREVQNVINNEYLNAGTHSISWNGTQFPSGIYFIYLHSGSEISVQKVTLLK